MTLITRRPDYTKYNWCCKCVRSFAKPETKCQECGNHLRVGPRHSKLKERLRKLTEVQS